ncbi:MAG TPA: hypothetical protein VKE22_24390 [Haliangiales bacterium]|nr:hypothetical protein [Haliangiales bacterium]
MTDAPPFPLSRETRIRLDRDGVFWSEGQRLGHPGLQRAFARWIDVDPETGRYILKNDVNWAFLTVDDAPYVVRGIDANGLLALSDDSVEPLDPATLRIDDDDVPYCDVKGGRMPARFAHAAAFALLDRARVGPDGVYLGDRRIPRVPRGEGGRRR